MPRLRQMEAGYNPVHDRLVLFLHMDDLSEFRFWITRRYAKHLWQALLQILEQDPNHEKLQQEELKKVNEAFDQEQSVRKETGAQQFTNRMQHTPLGAEPILLARLQIKTETGPYPVVCMHPPQGQGIEIAMNRMMILSLLRLLADGVEKADWDLAQIGNQVI